MSYTSDLTGFGIVDDDNWKNVVSDTAAEAKGYEARDYDEHPYGSVQYSAPFDMPVIPRSEWADRIKEREEQKARLADLHKYHKIKVKNQSRTNYCWIFGVVGAMEVCRATMNLPYVELSPASGGARIKNFRNVGGWGGQAIDFIGEHGVCDVKHWPATAIDRRYLTPEAKENAKLHRIFEFVECRRRSFDQLATLLLLGIPCPVAFNWWGHLVYATDLVAIERNSFGILICNSWGTRWKNGGWDVLREGRGTPDECHGVRAVSHSVEV